MYPRLKSWASPHKGFRPTLHDCHGRVARQRSARRTVLFGRGVLSPGFIRRGVGVWKRTFATATRRGDRLTHTALILGVLSNAVTSRTVAPCRSGDGLDPVSAHYRDIQSGAALLRPLCRGQSGPNTVSRHEHLKYLKVSKTSPLTGLSVEIQGVSDALPPTAEAVGFRAAQL